VANFDVREATEADLEAIAAVASATGQDDEWGGANAAYTRHLLRHGRVVVASQNGSIAGFGATARSVPGRPRCVHALRPDR
jgi:hypothetical protein